MSETKPLEVTGKCDAKEEAKTAEQKSNMMDTSVAEDDVSLGRYGNFALIKSSSQSAARKFYDVSQVNKSLAGKTVWIRARLHTVRARGNQCIIALRQQEFTIQALVNVSETVSKPMVKFASNISKESIVDVEAMVIEVGGAGVAGFTQCDVELLVSQIWIISIPAPQLPQIEDPDRRKKQEASARTLVFWNLEFQDSLSTQCTSEF